jgi:hypothetical protein
MKYKLEVPVLTANDELTIREICLYYGYELIMDKDAKRFFIVSNDDVAYIQKSNRGLFIIWRKTEYIQMVNDMFDIALSLKDLIVDTDDSVRFKKSLIDSLRQWLRWIPGKTLNEEVHRFSHG